MSEPIQLPPFLQDPPEKGHRATLGVQTPSSGNSRWVVNGASDIVMKVRSLFPDCISKSVGKASFPAEMHSFEDVVMLRHRYPMRLTATARPLWDSWMSDLREDWRIEQGVTVESHLAETTRFTGDLEPFQSEGVRFLTRQKKAILADEMGLGKTVQALAACAMVPTWPKLIVAQPHVVSHWKRKIPEFLKDTSVHVLSGLGPKGHQQPNADIYVIHYLLLDAWREWLSRRKWGAIIFDEVQELRVPTSNKTQAAQAISRNCRYVWGLSGTEIYNRGIEVHHIFDAMAPGILGPRTKFEQDWCKPQSEDDLLTWVPGNAIHPEELGQYLRDRGLILRRLEDQVMGELPPLKRATKFVDSDEAVFGELVKEASRLAKQAAQEANEWSRRSLEGQAMMVLRKASAIAKAPSIAAFTRAMVEGGKPVILFMHHHEAIDIVRHAIADLAPVMITGRQSLKQKSEAQQHFENGVTDVVIIGLRAATGIDGLQKRAQTVLFGELDWSPAVHLQAEKRAHRWGQKNTVSAFYLCGQMSFDIEMLDFLKTKIRQAQRILLDEEVSEEQIAADAAECERLMESLLKKLRSMK